MGQVNRGLFLTYMYFFMQRKRKGLPPYLKWTGNWLFVLILSFKTDMITANRKRRAWKCSGLNKIQTLTSAIRIKSIQCSTSWATRPTGEGLLCELMITRWRWTIYVQSSIDSEASSTVFHQLSYMVNWRRIIVWVHDNSVKMEVDVQFISKSYNWTAESEASLTASSQFWTLFNQWVEETWKFQSLTKF